MFTCMTHCAKVELQVILTEFVRHHKFLCLEKLGDHTKERFDVDQKSKNTQGSEKMS